LSSETLLLVDLEAAAQSAGAILSARGYKVLTATTSERALLLLETRPEIELVAAGLTLYGGECGAALIGKIRLCYSSVAVMLIAHEQSNQPGSAVPTLLQPFTSSGLLERVRELLEENRRTIATLLCIIETNPAARDAMREARESLISGVRRSRRQRAERFCSDLRVPGATLPCVLVADDDFVLRYAVCHFLTQQGLRVLAAASVEEALRISRLHFGRIDLLLTDFHMPGLTGMDLIETMASERPYTRVLLMTGADRHFAVATLRKPFELDDLLIEIATVLVTVS